MDSVLPVAFGVEVGREHPDGLLQSRLSDPGGLVPGVV